MQHRAALLLAGLAPLAAAFNVKVTSQCPFNVYGWNVLDSYGQDTPLFTLNAANPTWSGPQESRSDNGGGCSLKLKTTPNIFDGLAVNQLEYKMAAGILYYDWSNINGDCFHDHNVKMTTSVASCPDVQCFAGESQCAQAYLHPDDLRTLACPGGADIEVVLCQGQAAPAPPSTPAPAPSPAPAPPTTLQPAPKPSVPAPANQGAQFLQNADDGVDIVYETVVKAITVTVSMPGAAPTGDVKREAHMHAHAQRGRSRVAGRHAHLH